MRTRQNHVSWVSCAGLVLLGGGPYVHRSDDPLPDAELVTKDSSFAGFSLTYDLRNSCPVQDGESVILTGGSDHKPPNSVVRYNIQGYVEDLPSLNEGRWHHVCAPLYTSDGLVIIVAGGWDGKNTHSSTEKLLVGSSAWETIKPLPRYLGTAKAINLGNTIYLLGGSSDITKVDGKLNFNLRDEILAFDAENESWEEVGKMQRARSSHAVTKIDASGLVDLCH